MISNDKINYDFYNFRLQGRNSKNKMNTSRERYYLEWERINKMVDTMKYFDYFISSIENKAYSKST